MNKAKRLPRFFLAVYLLTAVSAVLYASFMLSAPFADWFNQNISSIGRTLLAYVSNLLPFSITELLLLLIPLWLFLLILLAKRYADSLHNALVYLGMLGGMICIVLILFVWNFAPGYYGSTLAQKLELDRTKVSAKELQSTALILSEELNGLVDEITFLDSGASVMPYSHEEMNQKLLGAYERFSANHDFIHTFSSRAKPIMLSDAMSYTHITGIYTFFTGEANLNINFPDYTLPYTAAHELAHQRGIAREDEANFIAFLVCMETDDPYIRYSAILNLYEYVANALYSASPKLYTEVYKTIPQEIHDEGRAYSVFFDKYRDNVVADISQATNNAYLQSQGNKEGTRSYSMVVDLAVAYYRPQFGTQSNISPPAA